MTALPADVRAILACPRCGGALRDVTQGGAAGLLCETCAVVYPVEEGIPVLLAERAQSSAQG